MIFLKQDSFMVPLVDASSGSQDGRGGRDPKRVLASAIVNASAEVCPDVCSVAAASGSQDGRGGRDPIRDLASTIVVALDGSQTAVVDTDTFSAASACADSTAEDAPNGGHDVRGGRGPKRDLASAIVNVPNVERPEPVLPPPKVRRRIWGKTTAPN